MHRHGRGDSIAWGLFPWGDKDEAMLSAEERFSSMEMSHARLDGLKARDLAQFTQRC